MSPPFKGAEENFRDKKFRDFCAIHKNHEKIHRNFHEFTKITKIWSYVYCIRMKLNSKPRN